jgi:hypothetical protein
MSPALERRRLQITVAVATVVPIFGGVWGAFGPSVTHDAAAIAADSHHRYLSGLLLAIGVAFLSTVLHIEQRTARFRLLAALVVTGGLVRLVSLISLGQPTAQIVFALTMELGVVPFLTLWQWRVATLGSSDSADGSTAPT